MEHIMARARRPRATIVDLHSVCGHTTHGVPAYSNGTSNTWTSKKSYRDGVFMGYQWQCVEFARRWLWTTQRLLLPERNCAYCFSSCPYVYRLKHDPTDPRQRPAHGSNKESSGTVVETNKRTIVTATATRAIDFNAAASPETNAADQTIVTSTTEMAVEVAGPRQNPSAWEKVPVVFVKQGSLVPPVPSSLIIYPMSWGSPWGHIGVITEVDLQRGLVYVADQNRYFHEWGHKAYSAAFPLEVSNGRYYIRDHESECKGWMTFPSTVEGHG